MVSCERIKLQSIIDHISNMIDLQNIYKSGFIARLNAATLYLTDQRESIDLGGACTQLDAFTYTIISIAQAHRISSQTAFELSEGLPYSAEVIKSKLGC